MFFFSKNSCNYYIKYCTNYIDAITPSDPAATFDFLIKSIAVREYGGSITFILLLAFLSVFVTGATCINKKTLIIED